MRKKLLKAWPILASVILLGLAFPPFELSLLVFAALAPWLASLRDTDVKGSMRSGATFGFFYILFQMFWLVGFLFEWTGNPILAIIPWVVTGIIGAAMYIPLGWLIHRCWTQKLVWLIPLIWAGHEAFRSYIVVLAFPWGILANPLWMFPQFVQLASLGTIFMVSAWLMLPNLAMAMLIWPEKTDEGEKIPPSQTMFKMAILFGSILMVSVFRYIQMPATTRKVFTLGQPGVDMAYTPDEKRLPDLESAGLLIQSRAEIQGTDLLVLPEGFSSQAPNKPPFGPLGEFPSVPVLMGGVRREGADAFESAYGYDGKWSWADKTRLVVFGEYVPFRGAPWLQGFNIGKEDLVPGKELKTVKVNGIVTGPLLCFEGVFPDLADRHGREGAQVLAQLCIDDWYEKTPAWAQLWHSSVWRSIESGLPLVRVGGRGQTLATDARGQIVTMVPKGQMAAARVEIGIPEKSDAFPMRMAFAYLCWGTCGFVAIKKPKAKK